MIYRAGPVGGGRPNIGSVHAQGWWGFVLLRGSIRPAIKWPINISHGDRSWDASASSERNGTGATVWQSL